MTKVQYQEAERMNKLAQNKPVKDPQAEHSLMTRDYLQAFLKLYWLRPESALLCALLAKQLVKHCELQSLADNLDFSCGDGLFAFTLLGGELQAEFNLYASSKIDSAIVDKKDIYDSIDRAYQPKVLQAPLTTMRAGLDVNQNMLARAERLGIYRELIHAKAEEYDTTASDRAESAAYTSASIFSSIYMYTNTEQLLKSVNGVLASGGRFIVNVKTPLFRKFYEQLEVSYPPGFARFIERNMRGILTNLQEVAAWEQHFEKAGFQIIAKENTMNASLVPVWTLGLRSLTPLLIKMLDKVPAASQLELKTEFIDTFHSVLAELYHSGDEVSDMQQVASLVYVLEKRA